MHCVIIATLVTCTGHIAKMTPTQAAALMKPHEFVYVPPIPITRDRVVSTNASPTSGPFGEFLKPPRYPLRPRVDYYPPPFLPYYQPWFIPWQEPIYRGAVRPHPITGAKINR